MIKEGLKKFQEKKFCEALSIFNNLIKLNPNDGDLLFTLANIYYSLNEVKNNIRQNNNKNFQKYIFIEGNILETLNIKENFPNKISFLRLDTDIYKTTKKQLEILYDKLVPGGVLHIDDYGICPGVKTAVDNFFSNKNIWLHRVDLACRYLIKK